MMRGVLCSFPPSARRAGAVGALAAALALLAAGPAPAQNARRPAIPFCLPADADAAVAGDLMALDRKLFEGLSVTAEGCGTDAALWTKGDIRFGLAATADFIAARDKGLPVVAIGAGFLESPVVFYTLAGAEISGPPDFSGKRIHLGAWPDAAPVYRFLFRGRGLSRDQIREVPAASIEALAAGEVDIWAGHVGKEAYRLQQRSVAYRVVRPTDFGLHVPGSVYFTTERAIRDYPNTVDRFLRGVIAGWTAVYADPDAAAARVARLRQRPEEEPRVAFEIREQRDYVRPSARRFAEYDDRQWKQLRDMLIAERTIDDSFDFSVAVNYTMLREAYRRPLSFAK